MTPKVTFSHRTRIQTAAHIDSRIERWRVRQKGESSMRTTRPVVVRVAQTWLGIQTLRVLIRRAGVGIEARIRHATRAKKRWSVRGCDRAVCQRPRIAARLTAQYCF